MKNYCDYKCPKCKVTGTSSLEKVLGIWTLVCSLCSHSKEVPYHELVEKE